MNKSIFLIHGPNFKVLQYRNKSLYGGASLKDIENSVIEIVKKNNFSCETFQHDVEGEVVTFLNDLFVKVVNQKIDCAGLIVNLGAYSHTSIAIHDALELFVENKIPIFEVHLSNIFEREDFRKKSFVSLLATKVIVGQGLNGYIQAANDLVRGQG